MLQQCTSFGPTTVLNVAQLGWHKVLLSSQLPSGILCLMCVFYELDHKRLESCSFTSKSADLFLLGTFCKKKRWNQKKTDWLCPLYTYQCFCRYMLQLLQQYYKKGLEPFYLILQESQDRFWSNLNQLLLPGTEHNLFVLPDTGRY